MNTLRTLVRREFWEHRWMWIVPLSIAAAIVAAAMFPHGDMQIDHGDMTLQRRMEMFALFHSALTLPQFLLLAVLLPYYLLDCLFAERKDRSILFWKALPISDAQTVLSKLLVALVIVPLGVFALTLVTDLAAWSILAVRLRDSPAAGGFLSWDTGVWLQTQALILVAVVVVALWYAPIAAYLLLVSAWAKRSPFLWAVLPPLGLMIAERIALDSHGFHAFLAYRLNGIWGVLGGHSAHAGAAARVMPGLHPVAAFADIDLWLGLAAAAGLVWLTIRVRRHQDD